MTSNPTSNPKLIQQGAEAKIFLNEKDNLIIKNRVSKSYRLPVLDNKLTKQRTKAETKLLIKANQIINSPLPVKSRENNTITMPYINGEKLSTSLNDFPLEKQKQIMTKIGESTAKLHKEDIIHGDLTTSNMILIYDEQKGKYNYSQNNKVNNKYNLINNDKSKIITSHGGTGGNDLNSNNFQVFFIDFGLGYISKKVEDKAVDIHLLKQALEAKHFQHWKELYQEFQKAYSKNYPEQSKQIFDRIVAVEKRGRYRH
jgi:tRNA A-37 threonylcarbamoyl transferase component Bud32